MLAGCAFVLTGCGDAPAPQAEVDTTGIDGLAITDGKMVLNAVEGNPAAVYFQLAYEGDRGLAIRSASVEGAQSAMIHEYGDNQGKREMMEALPITLSKGTELAFEPGSRHVMAMGVSPDLKPGGTTDVTLTVSSGKSATFPVDIVAAGEVEEPED
nr:copper chaperone PCu(A)C [Qipengyuania oceanensis]